MNRKMRLKLNTISGLLYQAVAIICGFILPRLILKTYGSETNGLVNSIQSILNVITLMELGVGAVVQTSLYKPLAEDDMNRVSQIVGAAKKFFRIVGISFGIFVFAICFIYPFFVKEQFEIYTTVLLILSISITLFAQYFFGIVNSLLIKADQKAYIYDFIQITVMIINTLVCALLMISGVSIVVVKFVSALIFLIRPFVIFLYVLKVYKIYKVRLTGDELPQKWNGIVQHVSSYILDSTDIIILTLFSTLSDVSIYSTYYLICHSLRLLVISLTNGLQSYYGNLIALGEKDLLKKDFNKYSFLINYFSLIIFATSCILIVPFIMVYTNGITDTDYNQFAFGILLIIGQFFCCTRRIFNLLVTAAGRFKQTQTSAIIEVLINVVLSVVLVINYGLIGVAIGTAVAMLYRTIYFAYYCSKHLVRRNMLYFIKDMLINIVVFSGAIIVGFLVNKNIVVENYWQWIVLACITTCCMFIIIFIICVIFNFNMSKKMLATLKNKFCK